MQASARIVAEQVGDRTRCTTLRCQPPLTFRRTAAGLTWVGTAAGPVGGDDLRLSLTVAAGATLAVGSAGASVALPGESGHRSLMTIDVEVAAHATLIWHPEPTVVAAGADHRSITSIKAAAGAALVWVDELVLGRHAEPAGRFSSRLLVDRLDRPVLRTGLEAGAPGWDGPAVTAGRRAIAQVLLCGEPARRWRAADDQHAHDLASSSLDGETELISIATADPLRMRALVSRVRRCGAGCSATSQSPPLRLGSAAPT